MIKELFEKILTMNGWTTGKDLETQNQLVAVKAGYPAIITAQM